MPRYVPATIITDSASPERLEALKALIPWAVPVHVGSWQAGITRDSKVVIVDQVEPSGELSDEVGEAVVNGASLLAIGGAAACAPHSWVQLAGRSGDVGHPDAEWFVTVTEKGAPWGARLPGEFPVRGAFHALQEPRDGDVLAQVNIAFQDRPVLTLRRHGAGRVITCALAATSTLRSLQLARVLSRVLRVADPVGPTLGLAIVGYGPLGGMGLHHGLGASTTKGLEFVAVCDNAGERLKAASESFPGVATYSAVEDLARDPDVSIVVVATPPSTHADLAERFLRAGKHVVCEKPMCFTPVQAEHLIEVAAENEVVLTVHQNRRWDQDFLATKSLVEAGRLGELFNMETFVGGFDHPCRAWHSEVSISGGAIYDWGAHYLDWTLLLMGDTPARVSATGHKRVWHDVTNEDQVRVRLSWNDGREAEFVHSDVAAIRRPKMYLQGTKGTLVGHYRPVVVEGIEPGIGYRSTVAHHAEAPADLKLVSYAGPGGLIEEIVPLPPPGGFPFHANLADHLLLGEPLAVEASSARNVVAVLDAAQRSLGAGGAVVDLPGNEQ